MTIVQISKEDNFKELFREIKSEKVLGQTFIDVGAYTGDTVDKALAINPNLRIVAIEPIKELSDIIIQKYLDNDNITVVTKACWSEKGILDFHEYEGWARGLSTLQHLMTKIRPQGLFTDKILGYKVEVDTLDSILADCGINSVDFIKIDTEGSEEQVLKRFTKYHAGTRFHVESHVTNLEVIIISLLEMGANIDNITTNRDGNIKEHVVGSVIGEFIRDGPGILKIPDVDKTNVPSGTNRIQFLIDRAVKCGGSGCGGSGKILNIGCADNFMFRDRVDLDVTNVDVKDEIPDAYKSRTKFKICDAHKLHFDDSSFDCAILGDILEHVDDPVQVLREAKRVARNVYITVPNEWEWDKSIKPFENPAHIRFYTYQTLKQDLDKAFGLDNYKVIQYNGGGWSFFCVEHEIGENGKGGSGTGVIITKGDLKGSKEKLNIALISTPFFTIPPTGYSGLEQVVWDLAEGLDKLGHKVTIFGPEGSRATKHGSVIYTGPSVNTVGVDWFEEERKRYEVYKNIINNEKFDEKFDIVHGHSWFGFEYLLKMVNPGLKVLHTHHGGLSWETAPPVEKSNLVAISKWMKDYSEAYFKQRGQNIKCEYVYNGIDLDKYLFQATKTEHLLFLGRLSSFKAPHIAIDVARKAGCKLDIVGGTFVDSIDYVKELDKMVENDPDITIYKDVTHEFKIEKLQNAKALILPSKMNEPFGLVACEAMACGTPVIAFDDGALKEIILDGITGFICSNIDHMVTCIDRISEIKPEDCRARAEQFSREIMAKNYEKLYRRMLRGDEW